MFKQIGFTLLELIIVLLIISILALIGINQYQLFVARAQFSESLVVFSGAKTPVQEKIDLGVSFSASTGLPNSSTNVLGIALTSNYGILSVPEFNPNNNIYILTFTFNENVNANLRNRIVNLEYDRSIGEWSCVTNVTDRFSVGCVSL
ncbi:pilus assembly protein [Nitrincola tibetensis]|uniref:Pilus assembly protein n=1 Tax=Nitrincola tibetensis TaxID=2219697 RepID=A0A364NM32_9GAMM|nr:pilin [Nitrincola tibetensis]RAU18156.1 pilus assembly protein [Nitrincola tibetensis]